MNLQGIHITEHPLLAEKTSIRLGGIALAEVAISDVQAMEKLPPLLHELGGETMVLGSGTNVIAHDGKHERVLVRMNNIHLPHVVQGEPGEMLAQGVTDKVLVNVGASTTMPKLLQFCAQKGLAGLEGLCGIPGNVGGAVAMNAGSYGVCMSDCIHSVRLFSPVLGLVKLPVSQLKFSYRSCEIPKHSTWFIVVDVTLSLTPANPKVVATALATTFAQKKRLQPVTSQSAGCVFKNPQHEFSAGKMLDMTGCKGMRLGDMVFSTLHANFLINEGGGTFSAAYDLLQKAQEKVRGHFGVELETEVKLWL